LLLSLSALQRSIFKFTDRAVGFFFSPLRKPPGSLARDLNDSPRSRVFLKIETEFSTTDGHLKLTLCPNPLDPLLHLNASSLHLTQRAISGHILRVNYPSHNKVRPAPGMTFLLWTTTYPATSDAHGPRQLVIVIFIRFFFFFFFPLRLQLLRSFRLSTTSIVRSPTNGMPPLLEWTLNKSSRSPPSDTAEDSEPPARMRAPFRIPPASAQQLPQ